jgi:long-chain acyl-CoA synthetase
VDSVPGQDGQVTTLDQAIDDHTGPGARFEIETVDIGGVPTKVFKQRLRSLRELARMACDRRGEREFLVHGDRRYTYLEFFRQANSAADVLRSDLGLARGERVAILSANNPTWCIAFWAAVNSGAIAVGLNGWWKPPEVVYGLSDSGARILVVDRPRLAAVRTHLDELPDRDAVFVIDPEPGDLDGDVRLQDVARLADRPTDDFPDTPIAEDDPAVILYTSGTTGRPKGAVGTLRSWIASTHNVSAVGAVTASVDPAARSPAAGSSTRLLSVPLFHVSGAQSHMVSGLLAGWKLVLPEGRFEPEKVMRLIEEEAVGAWAAVPTMVSRVCEHPNRDRYDLSGVTSVGYGGAPAPSGLAERVRTTFPNVTHQSTMYGLTETSGVATLCGGDDRIGHPGSVGRGLLTVDVQIRGADGQVLADGETGEVCIRGPLLIAGYWNQSDATAETIVDGWLHTGDLGHVDAEGYLYVTDRAKDVIIRGGENVYSIEIEDRLADHPRVLEAAVVGVPHPDLGEAVKAFVQIDDEPAPPAADLRSSVAATLADFKVPADIEISVEPLPRNEAGKVLKNVLRERSTSPENG